MTTRPRIGINCVVRQEEAEKITLRTAYVDAVSRAGGLPVALPPVRSRAEVAALLDGIDGLLLTGGRDYDPASYGAAMTETVCLVDPRREAFDRLLSAEARARRLPVLGVCCGAQMLAILHGGTLEVEIRDHRSEILDHGDRAGRPTRHPIEVEEGSRLRSILGAGSLEVNSQHHQAVQVPGDGLRIVARSPDGVAEAIEGEAGFVLGVQWHPELMPDDPAQQALFRALVEASLETGRGADFREAS